MFNYVRDYRANNHKVREFFSAFKARILATNLKASPQLVALNSYLTEEELELACFVAQQTEMQVALQLIHNVTAELDLVNARKVFAVIFTLAGGGVDDKRPTAAVTAASSILKWIDLLLKLVSEA